ncbi:MAG: hypothetical protein PHO01_05475 [Desulfotomaculaceae bacterium]|nr:hypothetical protein [Desulfotomaculaceae bacterium]
MKKFRFLLALTAILFIFLAAGCSGQNNGSGQDQEQTTLGLATHGPAP